MGMFLPAIIIFTIDNSRLLRMEIKMALFKPGLKNLLHRQGFPCVSPLLPRESICRFWQFSLGQMFQLSPPDHRVSNSIPITRLPIGSLPLQPAGLLGSLIEPLSGNLVLQVTLYTSLTLRGRTAQLPRPDFNWQVICPTRHTVRRRKHGNGEACRARLAKKCDWGQPL
jgi:hypothetical protein